MADKKNIYLELYIENAYELIENLAETIDNLVNDPENMNLINDLFRIAHTFKGNSAALGLTKIADLTHKMENIMDEIRQKKMSFSEKVSDIFYKCLDLIKELISAVKNNELDKISTDEMLEQLKELLEKKPETAEKKYEIKIELDDSLINEIIKSECSGFTAEIGLDPKNELKSVKAIAVLESIKPIAEKIITAPSEQDIEEDKFNDKISVIILTKKNLNEVKKAINTVSEISINKLNILEKKFDVLKKEFGKKEKFKSAVFTITDTIRIKSAILDEMLNSVSEMKINLSIFNNELVKNNLMDLIDKFSEIDKLNMMMQQSIMKARLMPIATVFNKFPRMMSDTAKSLHKEIDFSISGEDTELDKNVIDEIGDLLVHLLRNSIDHGIELPEIREKSGKPRKGKIELKAYYESSFIIIEISDDGKGMDGNIIAKKAFEKGIISEEQLNKMSEQEKLELIFMPGFSTAEQVTAISGRGVGMDAVKAGVEKLRGRLIVSSKSGEGSVMRIQLPLTLAIVPALICSLGNMLFAISMEEVQFITTIRENEIIRDGEDMMFTENNRLIKLYNSNNILRYKFEEYLGASSASDSGQKKYDVIIYKVFEQRFAFLVDQIIDQYEIVIKPLSKFFANIKGLNGTTILRDGTAVPLLNLSMLV